MRRKSRIILIAVNVILLALIIALLLQIGSYSRVLRSQQAARTWDGESGERFAQLSCFFPVTGYADIEQLRSFRAGLDEELTGAGIDQPETGSLWSDAYSGTGSISVTGERGTAEATAVGIGSNFFLFHPYELMSGSYISDNDLMQDRVVLDYELAWELFGSHDLQGMSVSIGDRPYYVAGVIHREDDKFSTRAFSDSEPLIFISYSTLSALDPSVGISCYELVMADPITGFVSQIVSDKLANASDAELVENSSRYKFSEIFSIFVNFGDRSIITNTVSYPYWENAARVSEVYTARSYLLIALLALFPLSCLIYLLLRLVKFIRPKIKGAKLKARDVWDDRYSEMEKYKKRRVKRRGRSGTHLRRKSRRIDRKSVV